MQDAGGESVVAEKQGEDEVMADLAAPTLMNGEELWALVIGVSSILDEMRAAYTVGAAGAAAQRRRGGLQELALCLGKVGALGAQATLEPASPCYRCSSLRATGGGAHPPARRVQASRCCATAGGSAAALRGAPRIAGRQRTPVSLLESVELQITSALALVNAIISSPPSWT